MRRLLSRADWPLLLTFAFAILATAAGAASLVKLAFPAAVTLLAVWWGLRDPARYLRLLLWTLILVAGIRHFVDFHTAFSQTNPIMLAPYLIVVAGAPSIALYILNRGPFAIEFLVMIGAVLAGLGLSLITGEVSDALLAAMRWLAPLAVGLYVCAHAARLDEMRETVVRTFRLAVPLIALYGLDQFVDIQAWDAYYMRMAPIDSIGYPVPFQVRVYATMNSPGALATMLGTGMLLMLPTTRGFRWVGLMLGVACLFLTTQRASLGGLAVALVLLAFVARDRVTRRALGKAVIALTLTCAVLLSVPGAANKILATASSVTELSQDGSAQARLQQYANVPRMLDAHKGGLGLGWLTNDLYVGNNENLPSDSGLLDILVSLGLPCGIVFLGMMAKLAVGGLRISRWAGTPGSASEFAAAMFGLVQLPLGSQHTAEAGIFLYLPLGLLLARAVQARMAEQARLRAISLHPAAGRRGFLAARLPKTARAAASPNPL